MRHLMLAPSLACPASCAYCFGPHAGWEDMRRATVEAVVRWQNALDGDEPLEITFHGGEPLVPGSEFYRAALPLLRDGLSPRPVRFAMQRNLWLLTDELAALLREYNVALGSSLDGPEAINAAQRGAGYFRRTMAGIERARAVESLIAALQDKNEGVRRTAVKALVQIGAPAVDSLIAALKDGDSRMRQAAVEALDRLDWQPDQDGFSNRKVERKEGRKEGEAMNSRSRHLALCISAACLTIAAGACARTPRQSAGLLHLGWAWPVEGAYLWPWPAVDEDGGFYAIDDDGVLHAIATPGEELWTYHGDYEFASPPVLGPDGTVLYFATSEDQVCAVGTDGALRWTFEVGEVLTSMPVVSPDGTVYVLTQSGAHRLQPDGTGGPIPWPEWASDERISFDQQGHLYLYVWGSGDGRFTILSPDGEWVRDCPQEDMSYGPVTEPGGVFYYTEPDGRVIARSATCAFLWAYSTDEGASESEDLYYPVAVGPEGTVYVGGQEGRVYALNGETGELLWQSDPDASLGNVTYLAPGQEGVLFALTSRANLLAFSPEGTRVWSQVLYGPGMPGSVQPTSDGGLAIVYDGQLQVYTDDASLVYAEPTPVPTPANAAQAEAEIVAAVLDFIVVAEIGDTADYIRDSGQPWVDAPPEANIIIWAPPLENLDEHSTEYLQTDAPLRVWWYADDQLTEVEDMLAGIEEYRQQYMQDYSSNIWAWGYYEFGILSVSAEYDEARIYVGASCGPLCGHGYYYTLQRSPSGEWWIVDAVHLWQS